MKFSNLLNLPVVLYNALVEEREKPKDNSISVTDIISPPLIHSLKKKYWDQIEIDISERIFSLLGTSVHYFLEKHAPDNSLAEELLEVPFQDWIIIGRKDLYFEENICDYKVTSLRNLMEFRNDWSAQLNIYKWMMNKLGFNVNKLFIYAFIRDWSRKNIDKFPIPFSVIEIPLIPNDKIEQFLSVRLKLQSIYDQFLFECPDHQKWLRKGSISLFSDNKEIKTFFSIDKLHNLFLSDNQYLIVRSSFFARCQFYCISRSVCPYSSKNSQTTLSISALDFNSNKDYYLDLISQLLAPKSSLIP